MPIVVFPPAREEHSRFAERVYQLAVQALLPDSAVEALSVSVLPGVSVIYVERLDPVFVEPALYGLSDELRPVVGAKRMNQLRSPATGKA